MDIIDVAQEAIEQITQDAIRRVTARPVESAESSLYCEECGDDIPQARREAVPGCTLCVECQGVYEQGGFDR